MSHFLTDAVNSLLIYKTPEIIIKFIRDDTERTRRLTKFYK
jgi:hypothetical protein